MGPRRKTGRGEQEEETPSSKSEEHSSSLSGQAVSPATATNQQIEHAGVSDDEDGVDSASEGGELMIVDEENKYDSDESDSPDQVKQSPSSGAMTRRQCKQVQNGPVAVEQVNSDSSTPNPAVNTAVDHTPDSPTKRQDKNKNRTCSYCGVVKPTPAALIRHLRKHTGEKPFVCSHCGKSYKAKRSLHLHLSSNHKDGSELPVSLSASLSSPSSSFSTSCTTTTTSAANSISNISNIISAAAAAASSSQLFAQVPFSLPLVVLTPPQAVSESTKSLLRETLESSRKAKDGGSLGQEEEDDNVGEDLTQDCGSDRLSTPNLVNLLTSDIGIKMAQAAVAATNSPKVPIKSERAAETVQDGAQQENLVLKQEEQAEDLSISAAPAVVKKSPQSNNATPSSSSVSRNTSMERKLKCEFCSKTFKHEISRANHTRTAHGIVVNYMDNPQPSSSSSQQHHHQQQQQQQQEQQQQQAFFEHFKLQQQKQQMKNMKSTQGQPTTQLPLSAVLSLMSSGVKQENNNSSSPQQHKQDAPTDLSLSRKIKETQYALVNQEVIKADLPTVGVTSGTPASGEKDGPLLDESNTLPYHVTSKMAQDFNLDELDAKEEEWPVLAEDGGQRRLRVAVTKESILATRLDGINTITGRRATVFKCHLCKRVFSSLLRFTNHLPSHHDTEVQTYDCRYCEASFRSHIQIVKHLQCHREKLAGTNQTGSSALLLEEFNRKHKQDVAESNTNVNSPNTSSSSSSNNNNNNNNNNNKNNTFSNLPHIFSPVLSEEAADKIPNKAKFTSLRKNLGSPDPHQTVVSDNNNNTSLSRSRNINTNGKSSTNGLGFGSPAVYAQGDTMKAIDLRRGEEVEVRMTSDVTDAETMRQRQALAQHYQLQAIMMMKAAEMAGTGAAGQPNLGLTQEQLMERARSFKALSELAARGTRVAAPQSLVPIPRQSAPVSKSSGLEDLSNHRKRKLEGEESRSRKRRDREVQEALDARIVREKENRIRMQEQAQLKEKLAQEGMGDVTVVLPDAPPMEATDLSVSAQPLALTSTSSSSSSRSVSATALALMKDAAQPPPPPAGVGFMARKSGGSAVKPDIPSPSVPTVAGSASRIDNVLKKEYGTGGHSALDGERTILTIDLTKAGVKRPVPGASFTPVTSSPSKSPAVPATSTPASAGPPPAKSRRKAHKPQRINHCLEETDCADSIDQPPPPTQAQANENKANTSSDANNSYKCMDSNEQKVAVNTAVTSSKPTTPSQKTDHVEEEKDTKAAPIEQQKTMEVPTVSEKDVAENLSTKSVAVSSSTPSTPTPVPAPSTPASGLPSTPASGLPSTATATPSLLDAAALQSQLGQQQVLAGLMALGALGGAMPAPAVTPTVAANAAGDLVRKNLEMMLARAAQGGANALFGNPVNAAAAAAPLFMPRYLMAGLANFGNMAALNGGVAPGAVPGAGLFGAANAASIYSAMAAAAAVNNANTVNESSNKTMSDETDGSNNTANSNSNEETIAIDLSRDSKKNAATTNHTTPSIPNTTNQAHTNKSAVSNPSPSSSSAATAPQFSLVTNGTSNAVARKSSTATEETDSLKQQDSSKQRKFKPGNFTRSISLDPSALDSSKDHNLPLSLTTNSKASKATVGATDFSKTSLLSVQVSQNSNQGNGSSWKQDEADSSEETPPENFLGVTINKEVVSHGGGSSPSPVPSPTNSDTSADRKAAINTTSLSRTHSRLSVVNEPVDRNSLCKPKVLEDGRSVYSCAICHKHFLSLSDINRHMDFHEDIRPYKCQYCDYYARTNSQLKVHKLRHEGVREFCCRVCNYKGVTQSDLNRHMKSQVHLLRSNNVCPSCGEGFVTPKALRDHQGSCTGQADKSMEEDGVMGLGEENGLGSRALVGDLDDELGYNEEDEDEYEQEERLNMEENGLVLAV